MTIHARELVDARLGFLRDERVARVIDADTDISDPSAPFFAARPSDLSHPGVDRVLRSSHGRLRCAVPTFHFGRLARSAGLSHPNIHFVLSAKRETHIESDAPYDLRCWNFAGYRAVFDRLQAFADYPDERVRSGVAAFTDGAVAGYLGGNFADLYADACASVLSSA